MLLGVLKLIHSTNEIMLFKLSELSTVRGSAGIVLLCL